ncbi:TolC family protein [Endozoicomonas atrinae]|uniref:TolC family protein n=1 Tax=Endozoicomonas atrinae TaxID=1333660 RepID=UPI0008241D90|nr:TolC family protein [Endozoicomonas atrinae]
MGATISADYASADEQTLELDLKSFLGIVTRDNLVIQSSVLDWNASQFATQNEEGQFDTELRGSIIHEKNEQRNTIQESLSRSSLSEFEESSNNFSLGLYKQAKSGATLEFEVSQSKLTNSVQPDFLYGKENVFKAGVKLRQPFLKNGGSSATLPLQASQVGEDIAFQGYRNARLEEAYKAIFAYWDFYQAQENLKISQHSIELLEQMLANAKKRVQFDNIPLTDVMRIESRLAAEEAILNQANQNFIEAMNILKDYMAISSVESDYVIKAESADFETLIASLSMPALDSVSSVNTAYQLNPSYLSAVKTAEQEKIKLVYAENQSLIQLDVLASYHQNGLDMRAHDAINDTLSGDYPGFSVGVEFVIPLANNIGRSQVGVANVRTQQAIYAIKETEIKLANQLKTLIADIENKYSIVQQLDKVRKINKELFLIHQSSYDKGQASIDDVIDSERRYEITLSELLSAIAAYQKSKFMLKKAEGSLFSYFDIADQVSPPNPEGLPL